MFMIVFSMGHGFRKFQVLGSPTMRPKSGKVRPALNQWGLSQRDG